MSARQRMHDAEHRAADAARHAMPALILTALLLLSNDPRVVGTHRNRR